MLIIPCATQGFLRYNFRYNTLIKEFIMKPLNRLFFALSFILSVCFSAGFASYAPAFAEQNYGYLRVITEDAPFFADSGGNNLLFYLPYTYYVKALDSGTYFTHVEISPTFGAVIDGYVPTEKLYYDALTVTSPYPDVSITTAKSAAFYKTAVATEILQYVFENRTLCYYGELTVNGEKLYFAGYNNRLGYIKESDVMPFAFGLHPNPLTFIPDDPEPVPDDSANVEPAEENTDVLRIVIIGCLAFAGLIALFFAVKSKPKPHAAASYYDENDYE